MPEDPGQASYPSSPTVPGPNRSIQFERSELLNIRERSMLLRDQVTSTYWMDALENLAMAADRLDAMIARTIPLDQDSAGVE